MNRFIQYQCKPTPWLKIQLREDPPQVVPISLRQGYGWVLTKDDPDGPLGGWWIVLHQDYMYSGETWYGAIWDFFNKYKDDSRIVC